MPYPTDVKIFRSTDAGASELKGAAGYAVNIAYACLVTGYNAKTPSSVTRSGDIVTVTYASAHGYAEHAVIALSGANEAGYNGNFRITSFDTLSLQYQLDTGVTPASPATGTIETRVAPAGWTRLFSATNKAVFQSADPTSTGCCLRMDDTNVATRRTAVRMYLSMTDVDTGIEPSPLSAPLYWHKSTDDTTARSWVIVADSKFFYFGMGGGGTWADLHKFGDFPTYKPGDAYNCLLSGGSSATVDTAVNSDPSCTKIGAIDTFKDGLVVARNYGGVPNSSTRLALRGMMLSTAVQYSSGGGYAYLAIGGQGLAYPHPPDNGVLYGNIFYQEEAASMLLRGFPPGLYDPWHAPLTDWNNVTLSSDLPVAGRKGLLWKHRTSSGPNSNYLQTVAGSALIDVTGPWR